jgi:phage internal scaffolding protein
MSNAKHAPPLFSLGRQKRVPGTHPTGEDDLAKQAFKDESDINNIIARYNKTGVVEHLNRVSGRYGDFDAIDFHTAMNTLVEAQAVFDDLPAYIRDQFNYDPAAFFDYVADPANASALGLTPPQEASSEGADTAEEQPS